MLAANEPVRAAALIPGLLAAIDVLITRSQGVDILVAVGTALARLGLVVGHGDPSVPDRPTPLPP